MSQYWPREVESIIHSVQDNYQSYSNSGKANVLHQKLKEKCGNESFYIIVYDHCGDYFNHSFNANTDQTIYSFRRGGCNVVVYRSLCWNRGGINNLEEIKRDVDSCKKGTIPYQAHYKGFPLWIMQNRVRNTSFMGMILKRHNVEVRSVNSNTQWGPGWWVTATAYNPVKLIDTYTQYILIAGYE